MRKEWSDKKWIWHTMRYLLKTGDFYGATIISDFNKFWGLKQIPEIERRFIGTRKSNNPEWDAFTGGIPVYEERPTGRLIYTRDWRPYPISYQQRAHSYWIHFMSNHHKNAIVRGCFEWRNAQHDKAKKEKELRARNEAYRISQREYVIHLKSIELGLTPMTSSFFAYAIKKTTGKNIWDAPKKAYKKYEQLQDFEFKKEAKENTREKNRENARERKKMDLFLATQKLVKG